MRAFLRALGLLGLLGVLPLLLLPPALLGCHNAAKPTYPEFPPNHSPVIDDLIAFPDTIAPSDSTVVMCSATDPDGDSLVYDWLTDARLIIQGAHAGNSYLNNQPSPRRAFYNANLPNPINDSAWVYCDVRDLRGGGADRHVFIILRPH
jgi:hypothetical protein